MKTLEIDERHHEILRMLRGTGRVHVRDLAERFQVSIDSVRRDLSILESEGLLRRIHGGAVPIAKVRVFPQETSKRYGKGSDHQNAVARLAASYIEAGDTIFVGHASIHYVLLKYLPDVPITLVTNSVIVANAVLERSNIDTYILGGALRQSGNVIEASAMEQLRRMKLDLNYTVGGGLTVAHGLSTATPEAAAFHRTVIEQSRKTICMSTYDKLGNEAFAQIVPLRQIDLVVTDWDSPEEEVKAIRTAGVEVVTVTPNYLT